MPKKGHFSQEGVPELWEEPKKVASLALTQKALDALDQRAKSLGLSRSELVERFARGLIGLPEQEVAIKKLRQSKHSLKSG